MITSGVWVPSCMCIFRNDSYVRPKVDGWSWLVGWLGGKVCVWGGAVKGDQQTGPSAHTGICHTYLTKCVTCRGGVVGGVGRVVEKKSHFLSCSLSKFVPYLPQFVLLSRS